MRNRKSSSALVVAGAAAAASAAVAATWFGTRRLRKTSGARSLTRETAGEDIEFDPGNGGLIEFDPSYDRLVDRESAELPIGHSADPAIDEALSHDKVEDDTSAASLHVGPEDQPRRGRDDLGLDEIWNATPGFAEGEQTEGYDAVSPEEWGSVWLERATQTTHDERPHPSDPGEIPILEELAVSQASSSAALPPDERDDEEEVIADDELDVVEPPGDHRPRHTDRDR